MVLSKISFQVYKTKTNLYTKIILYQHGFLNTIFNYSKRFFAYTITIKWLIEEVRSHLKCFISEPRD